jgi:AcrR family transcriptional regulator
VSEREHPPNRRRRLSVDERREELLRVGMELFSSRPYEEIWVEEIAERAGVSRGLMYHYFPTKRDFYVAVNRAAAAEVGELTAPTRSLPLAERLRAGIDAYLRYAEAHPHGFLTAYRGSLAGDPEVRATVEEGRERQSARILEAFDSDREPTALLRLAAYGWTAMAQAVTADWLWRRALRRDAVRDLLADALMSTISAAANASAEGSASAKAT